MHGPMREDEGTFREPLPTKTKCPKCGALEVTMRVWDSSCGGYQDAKAECSACGWYHWYEGPDS